MMSQCENNKNLAILTSYEVCCIRNIIKKKKIVDRMLE